MTYKRKLAIFSKVFACPSSISTEVKMQRHFKNAGCFRQPILEGLILRQLWSQTESQLKILNTHSKNRIFKRLQRIIYLFQLHNSSLCNASSAYILKQLNSIKVIEAMKICCFIFYTYIVECLYIQNAYNLCTFV